METKRVWAEINLRNLQHNIQAIKKNIPESTKIMAVVKADAYGHGYDIIAQELERNGIRHFGVATGNEALSLREKGITGDILVFGRLPGGQVKECLDNDITQTIFSYEHAQEINQAAKRCKKSIAVHIKLDTGMSRAGIPVYTEAALEELEKIYWLEYLDVQGIYSHFSCADEPDESSMEFTQGQVELFDKAIMYLEERGIAPGKRHVQNSAGIINYSDLQYDLVRPGICMYGYNPGKEMQRDFQFRPVLEVKAQVVRTETIPKGTPVSYGRTYTADRERKVATLPIGYGDGYFRVLSNRGEALIHGHRAPIIGRVCMDQLVVDVTQIPEVCVGDEASLVGGDHPNSISADEVAKLAGTISYEILCAFNKRAERIII